MHCLLSVYFSTSKPRPNAGLNFTLILSLLLLLCFNFVNPETISASPQSEETGVFQDYLDVKRDHLQMLRDEYLKETKDPPETQKAFLDLYENYVDGITKTLVRPVWKELDRDAAAFLKLKPQEPFSRVVAGAILVNAALNRNVLDNCKMIEKAASELKGYSLEARLYAAAAVHKTVYVAHFRKTRRERIISHRHLDLLMEWMSQGDEAPEEIQRQMYNDAILFIASKFPSNSKTLSSFFEKVEAAEGKMKPWLRNMILAKLNVKKAWKARGTGFAHTVTDEGWEEFGKRLKLAEQQLQIAYKLHPERPEAATAMITIAMAGETEESTRTWFDRAVDAEFDYFAAYRNYMYSLEPRWGGSYKAMIEFAGECVDSGRYDTKIPLMIKDCFDRIYKKANLEYQDDRSGRELVSFMNELDIYPEVREVSEGYQAFLTKERGFSDYDTRYYRAWDFATACTLRLYEDAYDLYLKYDGDVLDPFKKISIEVPGNVSIARVIAANGAAAEEIEYIEEETDVFAGQYRTLAECEDLFSAIEEAAEKNDLEGADPYFKMKQELVQKEIDFHRGQWVDLKFTEDLRHWSRYGGRHFIESPTSLVMVNSDHVNQYIAYNASFPSPFEAELTVEGLTNNFKNNLQTAGLVCGRMQGPKNGRLFFVDTFRHEAGYGAPTEGTRGFPTPEEESFRMKVNIFEDYFEMIVGEDNIAIEDDGFKPGRLGLALAHWANASGEVRYSDLRVRKLNFPKPPPFEDYEARVDYYQNRLKFEKTFRSYMMLAIANFHLKAYEKAISVFNEAGALSPEAANPDLFIGRSLQRLKRYDEAREMMENALEKCVGAEAAHRTDALKHLTWLYATCSVDDVRDGDKAVECAEEMLKLKTKRRPLEWVQLSVIAAAYAEAGQFDKAIKYVSGAIKKAEVGNRDGLKKKLELYEDGKPFYEE